MVAPYGGPRTVVCFFVDFPALVLAGRTISSASSVATIFLHWTHYEYSIHVTTVPLSLTIPVLLSISKIRIRPVPSFVPTYRTSHQFIFSRVLRLQ